MMSYQIIQEPSGKFCLWSSITEDFIVTDATKNELIIFFSEKKNDEIRKFVNNTCHALEQGAKPYYQFTLTYDEAMKKSKDNGFTTVRNTEVQDCER